MAKMARIEALGYPHHIIQRGNRRQTVFFKDEDKISYLKILKLQSELFGLKIWSYCLMENHVHLVGVPRKEGALTRAIGETHRLYTRMINFREQWKGYLWQGRFDSFPMDSNYLYYCVRYVECNPVRAGLVRHPEKYLYSSAKAHVTKKKDPILESFFLEEEIENWQEYLSEDHKQNQEHIRMLRKHISTGRPLGKKTFIDKLEQEYGRILRKQKPGPK